MWPGLYVGGHLGGAWSLADVTDSYTYLGDPTAKNGARDAGLIGGAQLGYSYQSGKVVVGLEGDLGYLSLSAHKAATLPPSTECLVNPINGCGLKAAYASDDGFYGDIAARLGYAFDRTLFYVKGGAAYVNAEFKVSYVGENCSTRGTCGSGPDYAKFNYSHDASSWGWTIGAGVEYALGSAWSLKAEYQHFDFGSLSYSYKGADPISGTGLVSELSGKTNVALTADAVKLGVSYHFGTSRRM
jgi:outer membrane immunogenic protein